jgi:predicted transcriptional regulator
MPAGRPSEYDPSYCDKVIELGSAGAGKAEIAAEIGVTRNTIDNWAAAHPEFLIAITHAKELSAGWWEKQGRLGIHAKDFNANAYSLQVRNRFPDDWRDRSESKTTLAADSSISGLFQRVAESGKRIHDPGN